MNLKSLRQVLLAGLLSLRLVAQRLRHVKLSDRGQRRCLLLCAKFDLRHILCSLVARDVSEEHLDATLVHLHGFVALEHLRQVQILLAFLLGVQLNRAFDQLSRHVKINSQF